MRNKILVLADSIFLSWSFLYVRVLVFLRECEQVIRSDVTIATRFYVGFTKKTYLPLEYGA